MSMSDNIDLGNGMTINDGYDKHLEILGYSSCNRYSPELELTFTTKKGLVRYMTLDYNNLKELQKIYYWDMNPKYDDSDNCYFSQPNMSLGDFTLYKRHWWL